MARKTLSVPPFPPLRWEDYFWVGEVTLPSWAGFQTRRGGYGTVSSSRASDGTARLSVVSEDNKLRSPPLPEQVAAFQHLLDNEGPVTRARLQAIFQYDPGETDFLERDTRQEGGKLLADITEPSGLRSMIGLSEVHVLSVVKDEAAYVGFEFGCVWDREHGSGV